MPPYPLEISPSANGDVDADNTVFHFRRDGNFFSSVQGNSRPLKDLAWSGDFCERREVREDDFEFFRKAIGERNLAILHPDILICQKHGCRWAGQLHGLCHQRRMYNIVRGKQQKGFIPRFDKTSNFLCQRFSSTKFDNLIVKDKTAPHRTKQC